MKLLLVFSLLSIQAFCQDFNVSNTVSAKPVDPTYQKQFQVGKRDQRVRFFVSSADDSEKYFRKSKQLSKVVNDHIKSGTTTIFAAPASSPKEIGLSDFSNKASFMGVVVNPRLITCASDLLKIVETIGNNNPDIFNDWKIDEINLFLYPTVSTDSSNYYKLNISPVVQIPKDPALNVQIPYFIDTDTCPLPSEQKLESALINASQE